MNNKFLSYLSIPLTLSGYNLQAQQTDKSNGSEKTNGKKMNIVFILSDDHRYDYMGFVGKIPWLQTPSMDRMAHEGAWMKNAFVTTSLSSPSRASILTGMYSHSHKVVDNTAPLPKGLTFFPEYLQKTGYKTAFFGKWHMGNDSGDPQPGFDHWEAFKGQGEYYNPRLNTNGKWVQYTDSVYVTDLLTQHAIDFIDQQTKNHQPFMVYLSHKGVHDNFQPAKRHKGCYRDKPLVYPASFNTPKYGITTPPTIDSLTGKAASGKDFYGENMMPNWVKNQRESWHGVDYSYHGRPWETQVRNYCETLRSVDESIGAVLDYLVEKGLDKNTIVIYMGDNGFAWGEHGLIDKRQFYEESVRVPMLVWAPGLFPGGEVVEKMVQNVDIAPTLMHCAGLKKAPQMVGESFVPLLLGKNIPWRNNIFYEYYWEYEFPQTPTMHGIRTDRYKYIRYHGIWDTNEFYDLQNDPDEMQNLIADPACQDTIKSLNHELYNWLESTGGMSIPLKRTEWPHGDHRNTGNY
ncbi:MAG TPA: sulfatase [Dysgonamonadaceae bacterium]|nr:sulfatase [Dysgonamonadaceae bacterium]HOM63359.1 sulfatase [Dysgonamonadaceae bacterium]HOV37052.1 sulfatase [Dysgonamonadaceae bacterium]HPD43673.1 sulfatase [Dysgonamonadaceae bacterium]HQG07765.1 sulfatase [Dysgonamonadaceae bacterium]